MSELLQRLESVVADCRRRGDRSESVIHLITGDRLRIGALHEWFGTLSTEGRGPVGGLGAEWSPPVAVMVDVAARALASGAVWRVVWVGRACWPYAPFLDGLPGLVGASILVDPPDGASRLWAMDVALRCGAPVMVVGDGRGLTLAHTRRLQLSAGAGAGLCLLARAPAERQHLSAAATRWTVAFAPSPTPHARWTVACVRNKDRPALTDEPRTYLLEWVHAKGLVGVSAAVGRGADRASDAGARGLSRGGVDRAHRESA